MLVLAGWLADCLAACLRFYDQFETHFITQRRAEKQERKETGEHKKYVAYFFGQTFANSAHVYTVHCVPVYASVCVCLAAHH